MSKDHGQFKLTHSHEWKIVRDKKNEKNDENARKQYARTVT